jgi:hypothetical protein
MLEALRGARRESAEIGQLSEAKDEGDENPEAP